ncbi:MAG: hypothetical protein V8Q17_03195 [Acutalibacteraceae bacterium]
MLCEDIGVATVVAEEVLRKSGFLFSFCSLRYAVFSFKLRPMIQSITATVAKQAITLSIEEAIKEKIAAQDIEYNDFVTIERNSSGIYFWHYYQYGKYESV